MEHLEEQRTKMLALAGGLHRRLGTESPVYRLHDNLLQMVWEHVERRSVVPPVVVDELHECESDFEDDAEEMRTTRTRPLLN